MNEENNGEVTDLESDFNCVGCGRDGFIACPDCSYETIAAALGWLNDEGDEDE